VTANIPIWNGMNVYFLVATKVTLMATQTLFVMKVTFVATNKVCVAIKVTFAATKKHCIATKKYVVAAAKYSVASTKSTLITAKHRIKPTKLMFAATTTLVATKK
jgi:hypothetical protein